MDREIISKEIKSNIKDMSLIVKKTYKIALAINVLSKCLLQTDPFFRSLRKSSDSLLGYTSNFHKKGAIDKEIILGGIEEELLGVKNALIALWSSGDISEKNHKIIKDAIDALLKDISLNETSYSESLMEFGGAGSSSQVLVDESWLIKTERISSSQIGSSLKDSVVYKKENVFNTPAKKNTQNISGDEKKERINKILSFIKDNGEVSVKDIQTVVSGVASKTIQRDLQHLIDIGRVQKVGVRRWAKYIYLK
jgi:hypothetical protein